MNQVVWETLYRLKQESQCEFVFAIGQKPVDAHHMYRDFVEAQKRAGFSSTIRFHDLRHTFASHFMMKGGNIYDLQKILGHSNLDMTQRYAHLSANHLAQAVQILSFGKTSHLIGSNLEEDKKIPANAGS